MKTPVRLLLSLAVLASVALPPTRNSPQPRLRA